MFCPPPPFSHYRRTLPFTVSDFRQRQVILTTVFVVARKLFGLRHENSKQGAVVMIRFTRLTLSLC